jgi:hypothetical protein
MTTESKTKTTKSTGGGANAPRFHNRLYRAEVGRTPAGSPILKLTATNPEGRYAQHRQMAAFIYELAADMERRSEQLEARWVISPETTNARVVVELAGDHETALADKFIASVIADNDLA